MRKKLIWMVPLGILAVTLFIALGGELVMQLWNWLLPPLFGWRLITFWQALGLLVLCRILFGGWGGHGNHRSGMRGRMSKRMDERMQAMTHEEREKFRQRLRDRCGLAPSPSESPEQS